MKTKTNLKKLTLSVLIAVLVLSMFAGVILAALKPAAENGNFTNVTLFDKDINTNASQFYDDSVIYRLPENVKDNDVISVIVQVKDTSLLDGYRALKSRMSFAEYFTTDEAKNFRAELADKKSELLSQLDGAGVEYKTGADYSTVLSGFEITMKAKYFEQTAKLFDGVAKTIVGEVYLPADSKVVENEVNVYGTGIFDSSKFEFDGTGMVVAVLDTGLDYYHSAFSLENFKADRNKLGLTYADVADLLAEKDFVAERLRDGLTASDVYINDKVPFGFDYADFDPDVFPLNDSHGTHVSGIIAGNDDVITGVAPNAQLVEMKIFSDIQTSARASWILSAVEDCVLLGVDVINMSIGTACGFSRPTDKEAISGIYDKVKEEGISLIVAASNSYNSTYGSDKNGNLGLTSNPDSATVGSPSTYDAALSIASISGVKTPYLLYNGQIIYFTESSDKVSEEKEFVNDILPDGVNEKEFEYITIPGVGRQADYTGIDVKGKIVLIRRGDTTFEEKSNIAERMGAVGVIIYNNVSGDIKMNVGATTIAVCSISQDDGELMASQPTGKIKISRNQTSGPFMSDFSSWGPTPDLKIKPELTAHGGSILSSITGQEYDRISGTSMACPNIAGATALLRQYVEAYFPEAANNPVKTTQIVNRLFMSTADIVINKNGLPYSIRKQGAGLANLDSASATQAYIITYDENGDPMDKTKIELGDDPSKTGVYNLKFSVFNFGDKTLSYDISAYVLTEGVSDTKTNDGKTTVTEEAYSLDGATITVTSSGASGNTITVGAGKTVDVTVTITLGDKDKEYLDKSFANGMYVEGFVVLDAKDEGSVDLSAPYLAFYGDWTVAPLFDLDYFATNKDELDESIDLLDKTLPDAYATRPIGGINLDYVSYLGSYYFLQDPSSKLIAADRKYIAISNDEEAVNSLRFVWAGMLRGAEKILVTITDDATGEVVYERVEETVRKAYGDGGPIYPANVDIEFSAIEQNLKNNTSYTVKLKGYLDYGDGGVDTNLNNEFTFPLVTDFSAPVVENCEFYTEYDKSAKKTRLFAKVAVYDNHYAMSMQFGYVGQDAEGYILQAFDKYMTPVYSEVDSTTYVIYELTDHIYSIKENAVNKNTFAITCYDYALNMATYEIELPDEYVDAYFAEEELTLSQNEVYTLAPFVYPTDQWSELLDFSVSIPASGEVARVVNNQIVAVKPGQCYVNATYRNSETGKLAGIRMKLTVLGEGDEGYVKYSKPVAENFKLTGYYVNKAYYFLSTEEREIGQNEEERKFKGENYMLSMYPSESVTLRYDLDAYFPDDTKVVFKTSNDKIVSVDENGQITANAEGYASITVSVLLDGKSTYYSKTISITVKDPYTNSGPILTHYYGNGGEVIIPGTLGVTEIGQYAFSNFDYVAKDEFDEISDEAPELTKIQHIGDDTIEVVVIPEGIEKIGPYAFAGLTKLKTVVLPSTIKIIDQGAFFGCTKLENVYKVAPDGSYVDGGLETAKIINQRAFEGANLKGNIDLKNAVAIANYAFYGNRNLKNVTLGESTISVGEYAFARCHLLSGVTVNSAKVKLGKYVFSDCQSLKTISINTAVVPEGAFSGSSALASITLGADVEHIAVSAFANTKLSSVTFAEDNKSFKVQGSFILSADGKTLVVGLPTLTGRVDITDSNITTIGDGAFVDNSNITSVNMPYIKYVGNDAFSNCTSITKITCGELESIGDYAFYMTKITETPSFASLSKIGNYAFAYTNIAVINIPDNMVIGEGAFSDIIRYNGEYTLGLERVTIGNNVKIGEYAFGINPYSTGHGNGPSNYGVLKDEIGYYYTFYSPLAYVSIGDNADIGEMAFYGACMLESVELGDGAVIGDSAFYNATNLKNIDLSKVKSIGESAFSSDYFLYYTDSSCQNAVVQTNEDGVLVYVYRFYAPAITSVDLSSVESIGTNAFAYCEKLENVVLSDSIDSIPEGAFFGCDALKTIDLKNVKTIGKYAFQETGITTIDLSGVTLIDEYAFTYCTALESVVLNAEGTEIAEGAFAYCKKLASAENLNKVTSIGNYAFAYSALTAVDLTDAEHIGSHAFMKEEPTEFSVVLGDKLTDLGENPFANCIIKPFSVNEVIEFNGKEYLVPTYTYDISESIRVIDGSLYRVVPTGLELVTFASDSTDVKVADNTVRITALAFIGTNVERVTLPYTLVSIGHKAFYNCDNLKVVVFTSFDAPALEEEFDEEYFYSFDNIPAAGEFTFYSADGEPIIKTGLGIIPYFMWNVETLHCNYFFGANFVDYIGHGTGDLVMIRPQNGQNYETFIYKQYFNTFVDGEAAADDVTLNAIDAISKIPEKITLNDKATVLAAREAYSKIAGELQRAVMRDFYGVDYFNILINAEKRIKALESLNNPEQGGEDVTPDQPDNNGCTEEKDPSTAIIIALSVALCVTLALAIVFLVLCLRNKNKPGPDGDNTPEDGTDGDNTPDEVSEDNTSAPEENDNIDSENTENEEPAADASNEASVAQTTEERNDAPSDEEASESTEA